MEAWTSHKAVRKIQFFLVSRVQLQSLLFLRPSACQPLQRRRGTETRSILQWNMSRDSLWWFWSTYNVCGCSITRGAGTVTYDPAEVGHCFMNWQRYRSSLAGGNTLGNGTHRETLPELLWKHIDGKHEFKGRQAGLAAHLGKTCIHHSQDRLGLHISFCHAITSYPVAPSLGLCSQNKGSLVGFQEGQNPQCQRASATHQLRKLPN